MTRGVRAAIAGVGFSAIERRSSKVLGQLTLDSIHAALDDAGLAASDVDGLATYPEITHYGSPRVDGVDIASVHLVARQLKLTDSLNWWVQTDQLIPNTFIEALNAVEAGACDVCVVYRAVHNPGGVYNAFSGTAAGVNQFTIPYGLFRGFQFWGGAYRRYMHEFDAKREDMGRLLVINRDNASRNPHAIFRDVPLTLDDYMHARMIAEPVCLLDCDMPVDGVVAFVITTSERAQHLRSAPAYVAGHSQYVGNAGDLRSSRLRLGPPLADLHEAGRQVAGRLWQRTGMRPSDVDVAQLYDGYSFHMYWWLEAAGFCGRGEAASFVSAGCTARDGRIPINTFGGQLSEGRLHGAGHLAEAVLQASGRAGKRQIENVANSLAIVGPTVDGSAAIMFTREPPRRGR